MKIMKLKKEILLELFLFILFIGLLVSIRTSYHLLFHTLAELYACLVSFGLFILAIYSTGVKVDAVIFLGIGYFFISLIDMFHIFIYPGVSVIFTKGDQSMVVQFWIAARYLTVFTLLVSTLLLLRQSKKIRLSTVFIPYLLLGAFIIASILYFKIFPACYVIGQGLTAFKISSEFIITAILILIAFIYFKLRVNMDKNFFVYMECHILFYAASELLVTNFFSPYDWTNVWCHIIRVVSYYFLYKAIIESGLTRPYAVLYHKINRKENELQILYETTGRILRSLTPREDVAAQCSKVMKFLDCQVFFNYLLEGDETVMHLNACEGITEQQKQDIEYLALGAAVCGCAVRDECRIVAESIQTTDDPRTELVKSMGIRAYACHPLMANGKAIGSLSFGTRSRDSFSNEELMLMKTVADSVSVAVSRKQNEEKLIRQAEELRIADQNKNEFLGALSHELRNPLASIAAALTLMEISQVDVQQDKAKEILKRQTQQLSSLVDDLLDITRITRNKIELKKERIELNRIAASVADDHKALFDDKKIQLIRDFLEDRIYIDADPVRVRQIIGNLLHNACKFTNDGGGVTLSVYLENGQAVVCVKDNGEGIDPKFVPELFEPFQQADKSLDRRNGGLGLGLSIVKEIVELHGGIVNAYSEGPGKGSEFSICLPVAG